MIRFRAEIFRNYICGFGSCQSRKFNFYAEFLIFRFITPIAKKSKPVYQLAF